jgi:hypothetical protein
VNFNSYYLPLYIFISLVNKKIKLKIALNIFCY